VEVRVLSAAPPSQFYIVFIRLFPILPTFHG
jgi:hypothetical protein